MHPTHMEVRGQLFEISSFLLLSGDPIEVASLAGPEIFVVT